MCGSHVEEGGLDGERGVGGRRERGPSTGRLSSDLRPFLGAQASQGSSQVRA